MLAVAAMKNLRNLKQDTESPIYYDMQIRNISRVMELFPPIC